MTHRTRTADKRDRHDRPPAPGAAPDPEALTREIELRAYHRYCERGCVPGNDLDDWIAAEEEVLSAHGLRTKKVGD